jgi:hypothetical protein
MVNKIVTTIPINCTTGVNYILLLSHAFERLLFRRSDEREQSISTTNQPTQTHNQVDHDTVYTLLQSDMQACLGPKKEAWN